MPSTPTSKSQVQAYRFMLRRMESALVRKDAVMLHDPMSSHIRAVAVGVLVAMVISIGFVIFGVLNPAGSLPSEQGVVIGKQSGAVYALMGQAAQSNQRLVPTFNVTSARLLLLAQQQNGAQGGGAAQGGGQNASAPPVAAVTVVDDDALKNVPRDKKQGLVDGPQLLPGAGSSQRVSNDWALCDTVNLANTPTPVTGKVTVTVLAGMSNLGTELGDSPILMVTPDKTYYLVYKRPAPLYAPTQSSRVETNSRAVRAKVFLDDPAIKAAYRLDPAYATPVSTAMLNAIPQVADLKAPEIPSVNQPSKFNVKGAVIGSVLHVTNGSDVDQRYVLLKDGTHKISPAAAHVLEFSNQVSGSEIQAQPFDISQIREDTSEQPFDNFPQQASNPVDPTQNQTSCVTWTYQGNEQHSTVTVLPKDTNPVPLDKKAQPIGTPSTDGQLVTQFYMPTGQAAVVRGSVSDQDKAFGTNAGYSGPIYVISDLGVKYGVASSTKGMTGTQVAQGLGLGDPATFPPAPAQIVGLLPSGTQLDPALATKTYDSASPPANVGSFGSPQTSGTPGTPGN
ncbi:type VII secretion protein EccB [Kutzneria albida]|uniref:Type VII secretion protein EccB n=1 Tax=Kutzneria albida DSM 43870 TaxID=1449976 RepID=W5WLA5_9PSEU|nr:type VII secretion protein EccB [Kutzneria albida]AHI01546.1 hypothetical protein KALB_8188 [Kutzneria albida DSM 43870]